MMQKKEHVGYVYLYVCAYIYMYVYICIYIYIMYANTHNIIIRAYTAYVFIIQYTYVLVPRCK